MKTALRMGMILVATLVSGRMAWAQGQMPSFEVLCRALPEYQKIEGVDYQPGVDANGQPVVPADLNAVNPALPDVINIPVTVDLAKKFSLLAGGGVEMKPEVAGISVHKDGRVTYNGQNISRQAYTVCGKNMEIRETVAVPGAQATPVVQPAAQPAGRAAAPQAAGQARDKSLDLPLVPKIAAPSAQDQSADVQKQGQ
jgi:hypothetical protein